MADPRQDTLTLVLTASVVLMCVVTAVYRWAHPLDRYTVVPLETGYRVDLNTADAATLDLLPGIGPSLGGRIIGYRDQVGGFSAVEQLAEVRGIGQVVLERLRPLVVCRFREPASVTPRALLDVRQTPSQPLH
jgi:competence ComEA-like helix-hairpin-helix protein